MQCFGLSCHKLQVGDVCVSLTPQPENSTSSTSSSSSPTATSPKLTKASSVSGSGSTSTAVHGYVMSTSHNNNSSKQTLATKHKSDGKIGFPTPSAPVSNHVSPQSSGHPRKRRWSAPDQFCNDDPTKRTKDN